MKPNLLILLSVMFIYASGYFGTILLQPLIEGCLHAPELAQEQIPVCMLETSERNKLLPLHFASGAALIAFIIRYYIRSKSR